MQLPACHMSREQRGGGGSWSCGRLPVLLLLLLCLHLPGLAQKVSLDEKGAKLEKVFRQIKRQTGYTFVSTKSLLQKARPVTISLQNVPVKQALDSCFRGQPLTYTIVSTTVVVLDKPAAAPSKTKPVATGPPKGAMKGRILDLKEQPLAGAYITEKGKENWTTSKEDGTFVLPTDGKRVSMVISFVGYATREVRLSRVEKQYDIHLTQAAQDMNTVVVVGYGMQKKGDLTGAVASADLDAFRDAPNINIAQSLQGTMPGLDVGPVLSAGDDPVLQVRGRTTISGNTLPLVVVDGVPFTGSLSDLNPEDVASVELLKDASAAAVYGAQAANGVILISSRKGRNNQKPRVSFSSSMGIQAPTVQLRPLNRAEFLEKIRDLYYDSAFLAPDYTTPNPAFDLAGKVDFTMKDSSGKLLPNDFNWWEAATHPGFLQDHQLSFTGGSTHIAYLISGGLTRQKGFFIQERFSRKSLRLNLEAQVAKGWKVGIQSFGSFNDFSGAEPGMADIARHSPLLTPYDAEGNLIPSPDQLQLENPFIANEVEDENRRNSFFANLFSEISLRRIKGLSYRINYGNNYRVEKSYGANKYGAGRTGVATKDDRDYYDYTLDNILTYNRDFGKHGWTGTLLYGAIERRYNQTQVRAAGFSRLTLGFNSLEQAALFTVNSNAWREALNYQMGRVNYRYDDRYLATATLRRDGFSGFAANEKFGIFPSLALAWNVHNEDFFSLPQVNLLKLRVSYGANGNLTSRYSSQAIVISGPVYVFGDNGTPAFGQQIRTLANPNLRWEKTRGLNAGLDFSLLQNRLSGNLDYYNNTTNDLLYDVSIPTATGFTYLRSNVGNVRNRGIELGLTSTNLHSRLFDWNTTFSISRNTNKITRLVGLDANGDGREEDLVADILFIGHSLGTIYNYRTDGLYQIGDAIPANFYPGTFRIVDVVKDNEITPADRVILGREEPSFRFSLLNSVKVGAFHFRLFLNSIQGGRYGYLGYNFNGLGGKRDDNGLRLNYWSAIDYWSPRNPGAEYPRSIQAPAITPSVYKSRSFVRLQDVSLTYNLPQRLLKKHGAQTLSLYASGKNLVTWTRWKGWDPESGLGLTDSGRPLMKTYSMGFNLTF
ncbi:SusC/RagA family TonB-linked outer membrane protein [Paraflavisolibacter sp. H34]|uniref:SusC/RagA family TonB-linked outer membrane protein n=1 Tax=Huijunlia imazamoxiresistens TaxID=3127457 RepID=UPI00301887D3